MCNQFKTFSNQNAKYVTVHEKPQKIKCTSKTRLTYYTKIVCCFLSRKPFTHG